MTVKNKEDLIKSLTELLEAIIVVEEPQSKVNSEDDTVEMLTIKECSKIFKGISEHAIRQLVTQGKIPCIRVGESKRGKILIDKKALFNYLNSDNAI